MRAAVAFVGGAACTLILSHLLLPLLTPHPLTTTGRPKQRGDKAFLLTVGLRFKTPAAAAAFTSNWSQAAQYCYESEPFLFQYEVSQSDKEPLRYIIIERYRSKADYRTVHRQSAAFNAFRPKLRALQERGEVEVSGDSYIEAGIGFT